MINNTNFNIASLGNYLNYQQKSFTTSKNMFDLSKYIREPVTDDALRVGFIINTDVNKYKIDEKKMRNRIVQAAEYAGVSPVAVACVVKEESNFKDEIIQSENGKGPMGITQIAVDDLFKRPGRVDKDFGKLVEKYGSINVLFKAKDKDPSINLGNLGNLLYRYKNPSKLYKSIRENFDLNLKVGAFILRGYINESKGNLRKAFYNYNGNTKINPETKRQYRQDYADFAMATYNSAMKCPVKLMKRD